MSAYTIKIGGSPAAPGPTYTTAVRPRYGRGINRAGSCQFDLLGLNGQADPTEGNYVQVLYGATVVWDGFIRQVTRDLGDITRHVTAADGLMELDRRDVPARAAYAGQNEGQIAADILSRVGITGATSPLRKGTMNAGNVLGNYRVEYASALKALRALAAINGRELTAAYDGGSGTHKINLDSRVGSFGASVVTWRAARDTTGRPTLQRDNWDQMDNVSVLGQGDGTQSDGAYGGTTGATGIFAAVPAKNVNDNGVAGAYATTLKAAFNDPRLIVVMPLRFFNLEVDQNVHLGDRVTIQAYDGTTIGDFRIFHMETDPLYTDGWFTRVTLIRAVTSGGANYPALPVVSDAQGVTYPGLVDQQSLVNDPQTYTQNPARSTTTPAGGVQMKSGSPTYWEDVIFGLADGSALTATHAFDTTYATSSDDGMEVFIDVSSSTGAGGNQWDLLVEIFRDDISAWAQVRAARVLLSDGLVYYEPVTLSAGFLLGFIAPGTTVSQVRVTLTNHSGGAQDIRLRTWPFKTPGHFHIEG